MYARGGIFGPLHKLSCVIQWPCSQWSPSRPPTAPCCAGRIPRRWGVGAPPPERGRKRTGAETTPGCDWTRPPPARGTRCGSASQPGESEGAGQEIKINQSSTQGFIWIRWLVKVAPLLQDRGRTQLRKMNERIHILPYSFDFIQVSPCACHGPWARH